MKIVNLLTALSLALFLSASAYAADTYKVDPAHTTLAFSVRHLGINNVMGRFNEFAGTVVLDGNVIKDINGSIQTASIDTEVSKRDEHLRTADFFDVSKFPTITFKTKQVEQSDGKQIVIADFTMHGVTKELRLPVTVSGPITDQSGKTRIGLHTKTTINRKDFGIPYADALPDGTPMVGDEVELEVNAEAVKER